MENIEQRMRKIVAEQLGVNEAEIKNESSFVEDLGADSLDTVELVMALEEEFETEVPRMRKRKDHRGQGGDRLHRLPRQEVSRRRPDGAVRPIGRARRAATMPPGAATVAGTILLPT